ncbi:MAG TPA: hypothetical protein VGF17_29040 [Phytomonospora sp.]
MSHNVRPTDRGAFTAWWAKLAAPGFLALDPPLIGRQGPAQADEEARAVLAERGLPADTSFACWLAPDAEAFVRGRELSRTLPLYWRGDHAVVRDALGDGPPEYTIIDGGPGGVFGFAREIAPGVGALHDGLREFTDLQEATPFVLALEERDELTREELDRLLVMWRASGRGPYWRGWSVLLRALVRAEHPEAWDIVAEWGRDAAFVLAEVPSKRGLAVVRDLALSDRGWDAAGSWLRIRTALYEPDPVDAAAAIAAELTGDVHTTRSLVDATWQALGSGEAVVGLARDERLPAEGRAHAADLAREWTARGPGYDVSDLPPAVNLDRSDSKIGDVWHRYRVLTPGELAALHATVVDPATDLRRLAICLELLYARGEATTADLDALASRWKPVLAKKYATTYYEWRHPMVTLTCLARDFGHPLAEKLEKWWAAPAPKWKDALRPLTWLGAPDEDAAARLWTVATSGAQNSQYLLTWVLLRARLDREPPRHVAARLVGRPELREYTVKRVLVGAADAAQPLWFYDVDPSSWSWWRRAVELTEDAELPRAARVLARKAALGHFLLSEPRRVTPTPTADEIVAAASWAKVASRL